MSIQNNFDEIVNRYHTNSAKYGDSTYYVDYAKNKKKLLSHKNVNPSHDVIPMWLADMDFKPAKPILDALQHRLASPVFGYTDTPFELIELMMAWNKHRHQWVTEEEWFVTVPSVMPGMVATILALTNPGDKIIIQSPVYPPFSSSVLSNNRQLVYSPLIWHEDASYSIDFEAFEALIKKEQVKMFILCNPHNPIGRVWQRHELEKMASICLAHGVFIFADEIHRDLIMSGFKHLPIASLSAQVAHLTITAIAPNKTFNLAGLPSASLVISNEPIRTKVKQVVDALMIDEQFPFNQTAAMAGYRDGAQWLDELLLYLDANFKFLTQFINKHQLPIKISPMQGTYLAWLDCRSMGMSHEELTLFFLNNAKVWLSDGASFGPGGHGFLRMNLATPRAVLEKALNQINKAVKEINKHEKL